MVSKERDLPRTELERLAEGLANIFVQRQDLYARQMDDGRYVCVPRPLKPGHILAHLRGEQTLGVYVLDAQSRARFVACDADDNQRMGELTAMAARLADQGVPSYLERSRRGGHLWLFLSQAVPGKIAREFGHGLLSRYGIREVELFPKQDRLKDGPGSLIRLPFGVHRKTGQRYGFITPDGQPLAPTLREQIRLLSAPQTVPLSFFDECLAMTRKPEDSMLDSEFIKRDASGITLSERIKNSISVRDFIGRYVELSPAGLGLCPFHADHHPSFAVSVEGNYWNCFAGCGGGSIIDFWMKWQDCDFKTAVRELAQILLK